MAATTSRSQKFLLAAFGTLVAFLCLEGALRLAGHVLLAQQDRQNTQGLDDSYVIACFGESTTQGGGPTNPSSYPEQLQIALDRANTTEHKFKVVNLGVGGTRTRELLQHLPEQLDRFKPRLVVTMMGINDDVLSRNLEDYAAFQAEEARVSKAGAAEEAVQTFTSPSPESHWFDVRELRVWKFFRWVGQGLGVRFLHRAPHLVEAPNWIAPQSGIHVPTEFDRSDPAPGVAPLSSTDLDGDFKSIMNGEKHDDMSYFMFFHRPLFEGPRRQEAERMHRAVLAKYPDHMLAHFCLAEILRGQGHIKEAAAEYQRAFDLDETLNTVTMQLGAMYEELKKYPEAERVLEKGIHQFYELWMYQRLVRVLEAQGKLDRATEVLADAAEVFPDDMVTHELLAKAYRRQGKLQLANRQDALAAEMAKQFYPGTYFHYRAFARELKKRQITHIAMQYPVRAIAPLKQMIGDVSSEITFVENRESFLQAVEKQGYDAIFYDHFGGDFGHCTLQGNQMIAENLAKAVLQAVR